MSIKNFIKSLILVMFFALCAKMTKMRGCGGGEGVREAFLLAPASTSAIKKKKTVRKNGGHVCTDWQNVNYFIYIYNNI